MNQCPVCSKAHAGVVCPSCGFDQSCNYESNPTLGVLRGQIISAAARREEWNLEQSDLVRCSNCGSTTFTVHMGRNMIRCTACKHQQKVNMGEQKVVVMQAPPKADISHADGNPRAKWNMTSSVALLPDENVMAGRSGIVSVMTAQGTERYGAKDWYPIVALDAGQSHVVGLRKNGTVVARGDNKFHQCDTEAWEDIVAIAAGKNHTVGLRRDRRVVAAGDESSGQCSVHQWTRVTAIAAGFDHTLALRKNGTVLSTRHKVDGWTDVISIAAGPYFAAGLRKDGTVYAAGMSVDNHERVSKWKDVKAIAAGTSHLLGLCNDGRVYYTRPLGYTFFGSSFGKSWIPYSDKWTDITDIAAGRNHSVGLRADGTVVAAGSNKYGQCDVGDWEDIAAIVAKENQTIGISKDGRVFAAGQIKGATEKPL